MLFKILKNKLSLIFSSKKDAHFLFYVKSGVSSRIHKYLDGTFHLEEIANSENMTRLQVSMIIEKFRTFVVRALHPDPNPVLQI